MDKVLEIVFFLSKWLFGKFIKRVHHFMEPGIPQISNLMFDGPPCSLFDFFDSWNLIPLVDKVGWERFKSLGLRLGRHETGKISLMTHYPVYRGLC